MSQVAIRDQNERTSIQAVAFGRDAGGGNLAPQNLGDIVRFAEVMARADIAIPKHLRDNPGACLAVCMQAFKWEMDPFSVAQKSYKVGDQMAYEAQLIAAVINTRAGLKRRPQIEYEGDGADRVCIVTFDAADGSTHVYRSPRFAAITTKNSPLWKSDPDQQLGYYSIRAGARRHFPEVILGVYDRDELEGVRDVTPAASRSAFASRISDRQSAPAERREGFDGAMVDATLNARPEPAAAAPDPIAEGEEPTPEPKAPSDAGEASGDVTDGEPPRFEESVRTKLVSYARDMLRTAVSGAEDRSTIMAKTKDRWKAFLEGSPEEALKVAATIWTATRDVAKQPDTVEGAITHIAYEIDVEPAALRLETA